MFKYSVCILVYKYIHLRDNICIIMNLIKRYGMEIYLLRKNVKCFNIYLVIAKKY